VLDKIERNCDLSDEIVRIFNILGIELEEVNNEETEANKTKKNNEFRNRFVNEEDEEQDENEEEDDADETSSQADEN